MALVDDLSNVNEIDLYSYCDDSKGNIEVNFRVDKEGNYKLIITEKDLKSMLGFSRLGKLINS